MTPKTRLNAFFYLNQRNNLKAESRFIHGLLQSSDISNPFLRFHFYLLLFHAPKYLHAGRTTMTTQL